MKLFPLILIKLLPLLFFSKLQNRWRLYVSLLKSETASYHGFFFKSILTQTISILICYKTAPPFSPTFVFSFFHFLQLLRPSPPPPPPPSSFLLRPSFAFSSSVILFFFFFIFSFFFLVYSNKSFVVCSNLFISLFF